MNLIGIKFCQKISWSQIIGYAELNQFDIGLYSNQINKKQAIISYNALVGDVDFKGPRQESTEDRTKRVLIVQEQEPE
jgi:hypothetical protein